MAQAAAPDHQQTLPTLPVCDRKADISLEQLSQRTHGSHQGQRQRASALSCAASAYPREHHRQARIAEQHTEALNEATRHGPRACAIAPSEAYPDAWRCVVLQASARQQRKSVVDAAQFSSASANRSPPQPAPVLARAIRPRQRTASTARCRRLWGTLRGRLLIAVSTETPRRRGTSDPGADRRRHAPSSTRRRGNRPPARASTGTQKRGSRR